jgi:hypothetical protein
MDSGKPHKRIRSTCKHCKEKHHNKNPKVGNTARFHGEGAFCRTHKNRASLVNIKYCGIPKLYTVTSLHDNTKSYSVYYS